MDTIQILVAQLNANPDDDALAAALTDALAEDGGDFAPNAAEHVRLIRQAALDARNLAQAATILADIGDEGRDVHRAILATAGAPEYPAPTVIVIVGEQHPVYTVHGRHAWWNPVRTGLITVGAAWVVRSAEEYRHARRGRERRKKRARPAR